MYLLHAFGILMAVGAFLVVNIIAIAEYVEFCSYYPRCFNSDVKPLNYIAFFLGVLCIIMLLIYLIVMPCYIMNLYSQLWKYRQKKEERYTKPNDILKHGVLYDQKPVVPAPAPVVPSITTVPSIGSYDSSRRYNPSLANTRIVECNSVTKFPVPPRSTTSCVYNNITNNSSSSPANLNHVGSFTSSQTRTSGDPLYRETTRTYQATEEYGSYPVYSNTSYVN